MRQLFILFSLCFSLSLTAQEKITLLFVGDLMQHQAQIEAARVGTSYDYSSCFKHVKDEISAADLAVANLEAVIRRLVLPMNICMLLKRPVLMCCLQRIIIVLTEGKKDWNAPF